MTNSNSGHKLRILLFITLLFSTGFLSNALGKINSSKSDKIALSGKLAKCSLRSTASEIMAFQEQASVILTPMININNITIEISDESGNIVFYSNENMKRNQHILINTFGWETGNYTILIQSNNGGCVTGEFNIK